MSVFPILAACGPPCRVVMAGSACGQGKLPPSNLAQVLERAGPAYIKLGQMLATRPDIVGEEVARGAGASAGPAAAISRCRARAK